MKIMKAIEFKGIRKVVKSFYRKYSEYWSDLSFSFEWMLENDNLKDMYIYVEKNWVIDFISIKYIDNQIIVFPYFLDDEKMKNEISCICEKWKEVILCCDWIECEKYNLKECSFTSTIDSNISYLCSYKEHYYCNTDNLINFFVIMYERYYFPKLESLDDLSFVYVDGKELFDYVGQDVVLGGYPMWKDKYSNPVIIGFYYLILEDYGNCNYLLALNNDRIAGIIKIGEYGNDKERRQSICYIDVNKAYQNRGVAKRMIKELEKYLNPNLPLILTDESDMGSLCRMADHFKNAGYNVPVYEYREFLEYLYK